MTGQQLLEAALEAAPEDYGSRLVYADWLEERGWSEKALVWRWLGVRRKWPRRRERYPATEHRPSGSAVPQAYSWAWYAHWLPARTRSDMRITDHSDLPRLPFLAMTSAAKSHCYFPSALAAVEALADALADLKRSHEP